MKKKTLDIINEMIELFKNSESKYIATEIQEFNSNNLLFLPLENYLDYLKTLHKLTDKQIDSLDNLAKMKIRSIMPQIEALESSLSIKSDDENLDVKGFLVNFRIRITARVKPYTIKYVNDA